jgi:hypothetical protein
MRPEYTGGMRIGCGLLTNSGAHFWSGDSMQPGMSLG